MSTSFTIFILKQRNIQTMTNIIKKTILLVRLTKALH